MLTRLTIRNFKLFEEVDIELGQRVLVGPNNSGKTSALQALALWSAGVRRWVEKRGGGKVPRERAGVTLNRLAEVISSPLAALGKSDPWSPDLKASEEFLEPLFRRFYEDMKLPNLMRKTDYHTLAPHVAAADLDAEVGKKLDAIADVGGRVLSRRTVTRA